MSSNVDFACHLVSSTKRSVGRDGDKERDAHGNIGLRLSHRHHVGVVFIPVKIWAILLKNIGELLVAVNIALASYGRGKATK